MYVSPRTIVACSAANVCLSGDSVEEYLAAIGNWEITCVNLQVHVTDRSVDDIVMSLAPGPSSREHFRRP